jgi:acetyl-CoA acetyltransferase
MPEALIIDACRTPRGIGKAGKGALADMHPQHLAATVLKAIAQRNDLNTAEVDDMIWGTEFPARQPGHATWVAWPRWMRASTSAPAA